MLLLDQANHTVDSVRKITVISQQELVSNSVAQLLRSRGLENLQLIGVDFFTADNLSISAEETVGVVIDIKDETNIVNITDRIHSIVPQNVWCCVIGNSDSISLAQKLLEHGILYFNEDTQLTQMVERIIAGVNIPLIRHTIKISVLSCKGGIGASFISSHIANTIATEKKVPVLLAQGKNGSQDLDLLFDKKVQSDVVEYAANLDLYKGIPSQLNPNTLSKYNFIVYDQPIFNVSKENYAALHKESNTFVLVVERRISSLRVAKQFLDECERLRNTSGSLIRTFICISDHNVEISKAMATSDIVRLLKCEVDSVIPYFKNMATVEKVLNANLGRNGKKEIESLTMKVMGILSRQSVKNTGKANVSFFKKLFR